jgi:hypothetical protein
MHFQVSTKFEPAKLAGNAKGALDAASPCPSSSLYRLSLQINP